MVKRHLVQSIKGLAILLVVACHLVVLSSQGKSQIAVVEQAELGQAVIADDNQVQAADAADFVLPAGSTSAKLRAMIRVENAFVERVCKLSEVQQQQLKQIDDKWLQEVAIVRQQANNLAAGVLQLFARPQIVGRKPDNSVKQLADRVLKSQQKKFAEFLTPEQFAAYEMEATKRDLFRREANADVIVALLDERLMLSAQQRSDLKTSLSECEEIDGMYTPFYFQNDNCVPSLPLSVLTAHLSKDQLKHYRSMQTVMVDRHQFEGGEEQVVIGLR